MTSEGLKDELYADLSFLETIIEAFSNSISRSDIYRHFQKTEENYQTDLLGAKKDIKETLDAFNDARKACAEYFDKNMKLENKNAELTDRIKYLKQKIKELENDKISKE